MKAPTRSHSTLNSNKRQLHTQISDWPQDICARLDLSNGHVEGRYDPCRGWQIVTLHQGRTVYVDCDELNGVVIIT